MKYLLPLCLLFCAVSVLAQPSGTCVTGTFQVIADVRWECQSSVWVAPSKTTIKAPDSGGSPDDVQRTGTSLNVHVTNNGSGGLTDTQLRAAAVPVTVGNFPATQAVSGTLAISGSVATTLNGNPPVSVSNFPATQPVSGTFWQATQPVSGSVTAAISGTPAVTISEPAKTAVQRTGTLVTTATTADQVVLTYTVTAGKTLYLQSISLQGSMTAISAVASVMGVVSLERPSGTKVLSFRAVNPTVSIAPLFVSEQSIPIPAGTVIRVVVTPAAATSMTWIANLAGYEQ